ncbi:SulP family inorganic anion transporter [Microlunatus soli]|uniref:High affinity sulphate transporter 1 n=1 Tax=Microlunatus soli TaxID=630515 RepID=A0A1H1YXG8_9ACTN|nr:SulP family inorganic anion transporter [Microlunatus soli]SDT26154.1 high affinity sulphate transporter 1 [Microlunatus soli]
MPRILAPSYVGFRGSWVRHDVIAGLTVWAVLVPESLAYAGLAGVPPVTGLYAAVPSLLLYSLLGTSRHLVVSPMSATAALSAGVVAVVAPKGDPAAYIALSTTLALATGVVALAAGALRLGFLASFISEPVLKGFIIGMALTIMIGQVPALLGIEKGHGNFFEKLASVITHLGGVDLLTIAVGGGCLALVLVLKRFIPLLPGSLLVALASIGAVFLFDLDKHGLEIVGHIDSGLPHLGLPDISGKDFLDLLGPSIGVMLLGFAEGLGAAKTYAAKQGYSIDPNRELLGLGVANLGAGLASGMVVNGSLSKTAVNGSAGAKSQVSAITAALLTVVTLLFLTGLFQKLPEATLAAVVIAAVLELIDFRALRRLWRVQSGRVAKIYQLTARIDFVAAVAALIGVLVFDTLPGLIIGIAVSLALLIARTSRPHIASLAPVGDEPNRLWVDISRHPGNPSLPGVLAVRVESALLFANADYVRDRINELAADVDDLRVVVLDGRSTPLIDLTAASMLVQLRADLNARGVELVLAGNVGRVRDVLATAEVGSEPLLRTTLDEAADSPSRQPADPSPGTGDPPRSE